MIIAAFDIGIVNLVYVVIERVALPSSYIIRHWRCVSVGDNNTPCERVVKDLVRQLVDARDRGDFTDLDAVVIERQMVLKMSVVAHVVQAFFHMSGIPSVEIQHGTRKNRCGEWLRAAGLPSAQPADVAGRSSAYSKNKRCAVLDASQALMLQPDARWIEFYHAKKKQDDLADALLHALWYAFVRKSAIVS